MSGPRAHRRADGRTAARTDAGDEHGATGRACRGGVELDLHERVESRLARIADLHAELAEEYRALAAEPANPLAAVRDPRLMGTVTQPAQEAAPAPPRPTAPDVADQPQLDRRTAGRSRGDGNESDCDERNRFELALAPLLVDDDGTASLLGISSKHFTNLRKRGEFPIEPVQLGRRRLWPVGTVQMWVAAGCPTADRWEGR